MLIKKLAGNRKAVVRKRFIKEFPDKNWNRRALDYLLKKLRETCTMEWKVGRRRSSHTTQTSIIVNQEDKPDTH